MIYIFLNQDTRTHVVIELFNTEKSYVESLQTVVEVRFILIFVCNHRLSKITYFLSISNFYSIFHDGHEQKYFNPLKSQENATLIDAQTVDEIFLMVPDILHIHQQFLDELRRRLEHWSPLQRVGDAFVQVVMGHLHLLIFLSMKKCSNCVLVNDLHYNGSFFHKVWKFSIAPNNGARRNGFGYGDDETILPENHFSSPMSISIMLIVLCSHTYAHTAALLCAVVL